MGRSSSLAFVRTAMALKEEYAKCDKSRDPNVPYTAQEAELNIRRPEFWDATAVSAIDSKVMSYV